MLKSKDVAKLFTRNAISSIIEGDYTLLNKIAHEYMPLMSKDKLTSDFFDQALTETIKDYKAEYFYKNLVAKELFIKRHGKKATMLAEFRVGRNKADCVILNGISTCYEIKTEFDNLDRLHEQISSYTKIFDETNVITATKHLNKVIELVPNKVGIIEMTDEGKLSGVRKAKRLTSNIDPLIMMQSLRKEEYMGIINSYFGDIPKMSNTIIFNYCLEKIRKIPPIKLRSLFTQILKKNRQNDFEFINKLPNSLISSAICYNISKDEQKSFLKVLNKPINDILK